MEEKIHLFSLIVSSYASTLEDKKTDRVSVTQKAEAWKEIEAKFNSSSSAATFRSADALKLLYENKKKELRRKVAEEKKQRFLTAGGPMPEIKLDSIEELLLSIINEKSIYGLENKFDSDKQQVKPGIEIIQSTTSNSDYVFELNKGIELSQSEFEIITDENEVFAPSNTTEKRKSLNETCTRTGAADAKSKTFNVAGKSWKKFKGDDLRMPIAPQLKIAQEGLIGQKLKVHTHQATNRRRPTQSVKTLTSSDVAIKYNLLLDKRLALIEKQTKYLDDEQEFLKKERRLKLEYLTFKISSEKAKVNVNLLQ